MRRYQLVNDGGCCVITIGIRGGARREEHGGPWEKAYECTIVGFARMPGGITSGEAYNLVLKDAMTKLKKSEEETEMREKTGEEKREKVKKARLEAGPLLERFKAHRRGEPGVRKVPGSDLKKILVAYGIAIPHNINVAGLEKLIVDNDLAE